jgi:carbon storage regulator
MLVLSRKLGQSIHLGHDIIVTILEVQGNRVKIGIDAPPHCRILRSELAQGHVLGGEASVAVRPSHTHHSAWVEMPCTDAVLAAAR